jgi:basic membrane lipoprotein Med (substrate-binding protein (PBP1-ABC) superfamily)
MKFYMSRLFLPFLLVAALLAGCSGGAQPSGSGSTTAEASDTGLKPVEGKLKVALLTPGSVADSGWSKIAYDGLMAIKTELNAEVNNQEAMGAKVTDAMRSYAQQGYHLIIGHGFEYNAPGVKLAGDFPSTVFVSSSGGATASNAGAFRFYLEQGFYLAGQMAGLMSKSGVVAMIGGDDVPSIRSTFKAFKAGAESVQPSIRVIEQFTGSGADVPKAKQATLAAIDQGADFVIHQANQAAQGVFDAVKERTTSEKPIYAFGANENQNGNSSGVVIASAIIQPKAGFVALAKDVQAGTYKGGIRLVGMSDSFDGVPAIEFLVNPALSSKIPTDVRQQLDKTQISIIGGAFTVPKDEF